MALKIVDLKVSNLDSPMCVDTGRIRFSWRLASDGRNVRQKSYQLEVLEYGPDRTTPAGKVWDSEIVQSASASGIAYGGPPLRACAAYSWRVLVTDQDGRTVASGVETFETGPQRRRDWVAQWISLPKQRTADFSGSWIWRSKALGGCRAIYLRRRFVLANTGDVRRAVITISARQGYVLFLNGERLFTDNNVRASDEMIVTDYLRRGVNVIGVYAFSQHELAARDGPPKQGGMICDCRIQKTRGQLEILSDSSWKIRPAPDCRSAAEHLQGLDWLGGGYDDSKWESAVAVCGYGEKPFQRRLLTKPVRPLEFRSEFALGKIPSTARAYVSALGVYELYINGARIGADVLAPGWSDYRKRVHYQAYDITRHLVAGPNCIAVVCAAGWHACGIFGAGICHHYSYENPAIICQIELQDRHGVRRRIHSGPDWRVRYSRILYATIFHGEIVDTSAGGDQWMQAGFDSSAWPPARCVDHTVELSPQNVEPIQITGRIPPRKIKALKDDGYMVDFGQNTAGFVQLRLREKRGTRVVCEYAELLRPDGGLDQTNLRTAQARDVIYCSGDPLEIWRPRFTYHGFRYVRISGLTRPLQPDALVACVVHTAAPPTGTFKSGSRLLNNIWRCIEWTQRSNFMSVPTDCPQRDERAGWTGDAGAYMRTAMYLMDLRAFQQKRMQDMVDGQHASGAVALQAPAIMGDEVGGVYGSEFVFLPWWVYVIYGDPGLIEDNYPAIRKYVKWLAGKQGGSRRDFKGLPAPFGDWLSLEREEKEYMTAAFYCETLRIMGRIAAVCGYDKEANYWESKHAKTRDLFNELYLDRFPASSHDQFNYLGAAASQGSNAVALGLGLVPPPLRESVTRNLVQHIRKWGYRPTTGVMTTQYLLGALSDNQAHETALKLVSQTEFPSWGYMIRQGATTIWERWDADWSRCAMNSRNHFALGAVGRWFVEALAGIRPLEESPGFGHFVIRPSPSPELKHVECTYLSVRGEIRVNWRWKQNGYTLSLHVPANASATVHLPACDRLIKSVRERGAVIIRNGKNCGARAWARQIRVERDESVIDTGSGHWNFEVCW